MWLQSVHKIMSKLHILQYKDSDVGSGRGQGIPHPEVCWILKILQQDSFQDDKILPLQGIPIYMHHASRIMAFRACLVYSPKFL